MKRVLLVICLLSMGSSLAWAQVAPSLGSAQSFAVLGNTTVTSTGPTVVTGDLGVSPGTSVTGFPPGTVTKGTIHSNDAAAVAAQAAASTAYANLAGQTCGTNLSGLILGTSPGAVTLAPGVYCFDATAQLTGTLTLTGNGVYVFKIGTTLTTATSSSVVLTNGATAGNVFWQVGSSATVGTNTTFAGNLLAFTSDTITAGASVAGRVFAVGGAVTLDTNAITTGIAGRWEIVHTPPDTSGDNAAQKALYPGGFSTFLSADGTGYTFGTFTNSICVIDAETFNVVPSWLALGGDMFQITIAVDNPGIGPDFSFVYTGKYDPLTPVPGNISQLIPAITGTYFATGGSVSACSDATVASPGHFIATFLPTISSGSAVGSLDALTADNGSAFDSMVTATITFAPAADGQIAGTVSLAPNPTFHGNPCFAAAAGGAVSPLTINSAKSSQSGTSEYIFAEGLDPNLVPTTLFLNGFSANVYSSVLANDRNAILIRTGPNQWAVSAAIGEDHPAAGDTNGVINDGTNTVMVMLYGVIGGACNDAGGVDAPFHFLAGTPAIHRPKRDRRHRNKLIPRRERFENREDRERDDSF